MTPTSRHQLASLSLFLEFCKYVFGPILHTAEEAHCSQPANAHFPPRALIGRFSITWPVLRSHWSSRHYQPDCEAAPAFSLFHTHSWSGCLMSSSCHDSHHCHKHHHCHPSSSSAMHCNEQIDILCQILVSLGL